MHSPIDAVLWDFGGVFTASPFAAIDSYAESQGVDADALLAVIFGSYHTDTDHPWHRCERGELAMADAFADIASAADRAGMKFDAVDLFGRMVNDRIDRSIVVETVRDVRSRGIRTAIVTNNVREYGDTWRSMIPVDELFDAIVDSCELGVRKPDPAIYRIALERLGVDDPTRAVFLDDFEGNVVAARDIGLHGIVVGPDPRPALDELIALLDRAAPPRSAVRRARPA
jgi:epoxide hydrolase-like predicted phosphatase